ncbi:MAG: 4Fe-4S binding protein [Acidobacteriota bacterium]
MTVKTVSVETAPTTSRRNMLPYRLVTQMVFVVVHVLLIRAAIPNLVWAIYGILFWATLVYLTMRTGRWVCAWICWLGGAQDLVARFARARVSFNPRWTQIGVLVVATLWVPLAWLFWRDAMTAHTSSMGFDAENWWSHGLHLGLLAFVVGSVFVLGKRGACRYFCPFGMVVDGCRKMHQASVQPGLVKITRRRTSFTAPVAADANTNQGEAA